MTANRRVVAVILAAGSSQRFGTDKLLYSVSGKPLGAHVADTLAELPLAARAVVVPLDCSERRALFAIRGYAIIENPYAVSGMGSSLAHAARFAIERDADALLVCLADMPNVTAAHLRSLSTFAGHDVVATESAGARSPPAIFKRGVLRMLVDLTGDQGARHLLAAASTVAAPPDLVRDVDTVADLD